MGTDNVQGDFTFDGAADLGVAAGAPKVTFLVEARALQRDCHVALLMRPTPASSIAAAQERFVPGSTLTDEFEECNGLWLQNDGARPCLTVDSESFRYGGRSREPNR
jgi:hypothetical protein